MNRVFYYIVFLYIALLLPLFFYSYGFVDANLTLFKVPLFQTLQSSLSYSVTTQRLFSVLMYIVLLAGLFILYIWILKIIGKSIRSLSYIILLLALILPILLLSYPAFSYDVFNYIATAKVAFLWKENPWIIMPIDIPNEPALAYTRAANKVALYGPSWILITWLPHIIGKSSVFLSLVSFKLLITLSYIGILTLLWKRTKDLFRVAVFAFNPLVLIEGVLGGHNDMFMMLLAVSGILVLDTTVAFKKITSSILLFLSLMVKGATIILIPLLFLQKKTYVRYFFYAYILMFFIFLLTPLREELYPWYAVWFLSCAAFLPKKNYMLIHEFNIAVSFGLMLRHAPYIYMGYYEGYGPFLRILATFIPIGIFLVLRYRRLYTVLILHLPSFRFKS